MKLQKQVVGMCVREKKNNEEIIRGGGWQDLLSSIENTVFAVLALPPF